MLTTGVDSIVGTSGNDTINAVIDATNTPAASTFTALDSIDGGAGTDTLKISAITDFAVPSGATVTNVENVQIAAAAKVGIFTADGTGALDLSSFFAGVQDLTISSATEIDIKAPTSANVTITGSSGGVEVVGGANQTVNMKAAGAAVRLEGGKDVTVNLTGIAGSSDTVTVGTSAAPSGNVSVTMTGAAYTASTSNTTLSDINVTGGKSITVTQKATSDASAAASDTSNATITQGNVAITANADTKTVTVKQDASVTAANATNTTGGVTETATVKFGALKNGDALEVAGLKFTASADLTAAEVAAVFANLIKGAAYPAPANISAGDTQSGGLAGKGTYTLIASGWTSSAVSGDTVVFTSTTANSNVTDLGYTLTNTSGNSVAPVVTTTGGATHSATPTGGKMGIATGTVSITGSAALETVTIDGYKNSSAISGTLTALSTLNLANSDASAALTVADTADTLALNLEKINGSITFTAAPLTLNVKSTGNNTATLTAAATTALNVSGTGVLTAGSSSLAGVKNIVVTESAGINLAAGATLTALESVNTTASTGSTTITINGSQTAYAGGAGKDSVTLSNASVTKSISLGDGDDTVTFGANITGATTAINGGGGTDTLSMTVANADAIDGAPVTFYTGFERLVLNNAYGGTTNDNSAADVLTLNMANLGFTNYVTTSGTGNGADATQDKLVLDKMANNGTVVLTANGLIQVNVDGAASSTTDAFNVLLSSSSNLNAGTLTIAEVETINVNAVDTETGSNPTKNSNSLTLTADKATTVNVTGAQDLALTLTGSTKVTLIDGSSMTGNLTVTSVNTTSATTIKGGSGADVLIAATGTTADKLFGGGGNDVLVANAGLTEMTGGAGNDVFRIATASQNVNSYATILDFQAGDLIQIAGIGSFTSAKVTLGATAVFQDYANAAINSLGANGAGWFQYGGDTYIVADMGTNGTAFNNGEDFIVKIAGLVDLSNASFNDTYDTIALV